MKPILELIESRHDVGPRLRWRENGFAATGPATRGPSRRCPAAL